MGHKNHFDAKSLLSPPVKRAAYSDRTAWLMAEMSRLAYDRFEGGITLEKLAQDLADTTDQEKAIEILQKHLESVSQLEIKARDDLATELAKANFKLHQTYNKGGTQAFLAQIENANEPMLVLAFRGTEINATDIKADLKANLVKITGDQKVHNGFKTAFDVVHKEIKRDLDKFSNKALYITGHSLGGALAIVATKFLASESLGACYTFGSPRVGNSTFQDDIKTPIYRIINAADLVPRVPPALLISLVLAILRWLPVPTGWLVKILNQFRGYVHYGDMRYLTHTAETKDANSIAYNGLRMLANPNLGLRLYWTLTRWITTFGGAAAQDHSIDIYCEKLKAYALRRN